MTAPALFSSARSDWETPASLFQPIAEEFRLTLDVCATATTAKCGRFYDVEADGLRQPWAPDRCWMNPPFGRTIGQWTEKALRESRRGALVVALLPVRSDTSWWHSDVLQALEIRFIPGRLSFTHPEHEGRSRAPMPCAIVVWNDRRASLRRSGSLPEIVRIGGAR